MTDVLDSRRTVATSASLSLAFLVAAVVVLAATGSRLVLAQAADSLVDVVAGSILVITVAVAARPADQDHPFGHRRAEPIGALITAVLAGVLAFEVLRESVTSLVVGEAAHLDESVLALFCAKFVFKFLFMIFAARKIRGDRSPALRAAFVDARNDCVTTASSVFGWLLALRGMEWADAVLAIPVGLYVGWAGFHLARENLSLLMGEAPPEEVLEALAASAASVPGVLEVRGVRAQHLGPELHAEVTVLVPENCTATEAHDIALAVRRQLEERSGVGEVFVHIDTRAALPHA